MNCTIKILARGEMTTSKKERKEKKAPKNTRVLIFFLGVSYAENLNGIDLLMMLKNWQTA